VIGLLASRIKERFHRPVVAFANANDEADSDELKGSARSIRGLHIRDVLDVIAARHPGLINKFGGHAMAAGLSIKRDRFDAFRQAFEQEVASLLSAEELEEVVESDGGIGPEQMSLETAEVIESAGPWGQQFPEPVFDNCFRIMDWKIVGEKHLKMQLLHDEGSKTIDAIAFNTLADDLPSLQKIHVAYRMNVNEFRNNRNLQLIVDCMSATD
jgi:single-stranded-DNA-specific exonuclease